MICKVLTEYFVCMCGGRSSVILEDDKRKQELEKKNGWRKESEREGKEGRERSCT